MVYFQYYLSQKCLGVSIMAYLCVLCRQLCIFGEDAVTFKFVGKHLLETRGALYIIQYLYLS